MVTGIWMERSHVLRSSAAADGGRCRFHRFESKANLSVAILGRRGRRPLPRAAFGDGWADLVAILGRRGRRPLPDRSASARSWRSVLRSSAAADGGRCRAFAARLISPT